MIRHLNFHNLLYEEQVCPVCYERGNHMPSASHPISDGVTIINLIPPYLPAGSPRLLPGFKSLNSELHKNFLIDLAEAESIDELFRKSMGGRRFKNIRRMRRRLEEQVNYRFRVYIGDIEPEMYRDLMTRMKKMIRRRFAKKDANHDSLKRWGEIVRHTGERLREKKASLMVISDGDTPISIGLNYHHQNVLSSAITGFDTAFEPFGLGKEMLLEKVRWAFENNYRFVDLGWGYLSHKSELSNRIGVFRTDVVYPAGKPYLHPLAWLITQYLRIKHRDKTGN